MTKVYLTRNFPGEGMERLKKHFEVAGNFSWLAPRREELLRQLEDTEVLFTYNDVTTAGFWMLRPGETDCGSLGRRGR